MVGNRALPGAICTPAGTIRRPADRARGAIDADHGADSTGLPDRRRTRGHWGRPGQTRGSVACLAGEYSSALSELPLYQQQETP
jgi:hypothetical protein